MNCGFSIRIIRQGWLAGDSVHDLCSHGEIELWIGGARIAGDGQLGEEEWSYGISEAAPALLRTLNYRHMSEHRVAERLIPHGCGMILMISCDIGIDWTVRHRDDHVRIGDVVRYDSNDVSKAVKFGDLMVQIPWSVYAAQIVDFAKVAKAFFSGIDKDTSAETIPGECEAFWSAFDDLLAGWETPCERDLVRSGSYVDYHP
jgi:hypothetical protein